MGCQRLRCVLGGCMMLISGRPTSAFVQMSVFRVDKPLSRAAVLRPVVGVLLGAGTVLQAPPTPASAASKPMRLPDDDTQKDLKPSGAGNPRVSDFTTLPSGVQVANIMVGEGPAVEAGRGVVVEWVLRRANGYYVDSSTKAGGEPFVYRVGDMKRAVEGFDQGIRGMKTGGVRRIVIPPQLGYVQGCADGKPGPVPEGYGPQQQINIRKNEPISFEVRVTKVR